MNWFKPKLVVPIFLWSVGIFVLFAFNEILFMSKLVQLVDIMGRRLSAGASVMSLLPELVEAILRILR